MKRNIESILAINRYLIKNKSNVKKTKIVREYLTSKVESALESKGSTTDVKLNLNLSNYFNTLTILF